MNAVLLIVGFVILLDIAYVIYSLVKSPAKVRSEDPTMGASTQTNGTEPLNSASLLDQSPSNYEPKISTLPITQNPVGLRVVTKQKFNAIGWIGVVLMFICPLITGGVISSHMNSLSLSMRYGYEPANYALIYLALGFAGILAFIFVIIGREFHSVSSDQ